MAIKRIGYILFCLVFVFIATGCGNQKHNNRELPTIVFLESIRDKEEIDQQDASVYETRFIDKDGNYYISKDYELHVMGYETLVSEYEAGNLEEKIQFVQKCDTEILMEQYQKVYPEYLDGQFERVDEQPDMWLEWVTEDIWWYGFYYDKDGELQYHIIHESCDDNHITTNNDTINEVYDWLVEIFRTY